MNWPRWDCFWRAMKPPMSTARPSRSTAASPHRCRMRGNRFDLAAPSQGEVVMPRHRVSPFGEPDDRLRRGIQYAAAARFCHQCLWNTGSPAGACHRAALCADPLAGDDSLIAEDTHPPSRDAMRPSCAIISALEKLRAQGKPGARCTRSRAWSVVNTRVSHHRYAGTPGLPCAMVLTASFALSLVTGLSCHHRLRMT